MSLITKLDKSIDDDSLLKIDDLIVNVSFLDGSSNIFYQCGDENYTAEIIGEGNFWSSDKSDRENIGKKITQSSNVLYSSKGTYKIRLSNKFKMTTLGCGSYSDNYKCSVDFVSAMCSNAIFDITAAMSGNLKYGKFDKVRNFLANLGNLLEGDVSVFKNATELVSASFEGLTNVEGDIESFGNSKYLTKLVCEGSQISGSYSSLCDKLFASGRTSGDTTIIEADGTVHTITFSSDGWTEN